MKLINGIIETDFPDKQKVLEDVSTAILDNTIKLTKIAGFYLGNQVGMTDSAIFERSQACLEIMPDIATHLSLLTFGRVNANTASLKIEGQGPVYARDFKLNCRGKEELPLESNNLIVKALDSMSFHVYFRMNATGTYSIEENVQYMETFNHDQYEQYFPCPSNHTLSHLIRIAPMLRDGQIRYQIMNNAPVERIEYLLYMKFAEYGY